MHSRFVGVQPSLCRRFHRLTVLAHLIIGVLATLPGLVDLVDELWHQGQGERRAGLSCVLSSRPDSFVLPIILLHHYLLEHTRGHLTFDLVAAERGRTVLRNEQL